MQKLYNLTKLNDTGIRLRFLVTRQIECVLSGIFPKAVALPFGSSVNGYGRMGCDLDIVLKLHDSETVCSSERLILKFIINNSFVDIKCW